VQSFTKSKKVINQPTGEYGKAEEISGTGDLRGVGGIRVDGRQTPMSPQVNKGKNQLSNG